MERSQQVNVDVHIFYPVKTKVPSDMSWISYILCDKPLLDYNTQADRIQLC